MFEMINNSGITYMDRETAMIIVAIFKNAGDWHIQYEDNAPDVYYDICFSDYMSSVRIREV